MAKLLLASLVGAAMGALAGMIVALLTGASRPIIIGGALGGVLFPVALARTQRKSK